MSVDWFGKSDNNYSHACECGQTTTVTTEQAGSRLQCGCGKELSVPSLSRLRMLSGRDGYESGVVDEISRKIRTGGLPSVATCAISRRPTDDIITLEITLPRFFKNQEQNDYRIILLLGWVALLVVHFFRKPSFEEEGATTLEVPLRVSASRQVKVFRMSQPRLRSSCRSSPCMPDSWTRIPTLGSRSRKRWATYKPTQRSRCSMRF